MNKTENKTQTISFILSFTLLFQLLRQSRVDPRWGDNSELWTLETRASLVDVDGLGESYLCKGNFAGKSSFCHAALACK